MLCVEDREGYELVTVEEIVLKDREDEVDSVAVLEGLKDVRCLQSV